MTDWMLGKEGEEIVKDNPSIRVLQISRNNGVCVYVCGVELRRRDLKNWLLQLCAQASPKPPREVWRLEIQVGVHVVVWSLKAVWRENSFLFKGLQSFLLKPSTDWMSLTHIMEGNGLFSVY